LCLAWKSQHLAEGHGKGVKITSHVGVRKEEFDNRWSKTKNSENDISKWQKHSLEFPVNCFSFIFINLHINLIAYV